MAIFELDGVRPIVPAGNAFWIAPDAAVIGKVRLDGDVGIWFGAVLRGDNEEIAIGRRTNVQDLCVIHTDIGFPATIGADCTIGHRAILHGCTIGDNTLIGMGAVILNGARIGNDCLVAAHALVPEGREIPDGSLVIGIPGKVARRLTPDEIARNRVSAEHYAGNWKRFAAGLVRL
jgi:carbonic anhydrase/acetyltransferase-like protein (isoleucine patch superfamily)